MELYNFFSETTSDKQKIEELKIILDELKPICIFVKMISRKNLNGVNEYTIIGQLYGDDTNAGDTTLLSVFMDVKYTWFDAHEHSINSIYSSN